MSKNNNNFFKSIVKNKRNLKIFIAGLCSLIALITVIVILARPVVYNKDYTCNHLPSGTTTMSVYFHQSGVMKVSSNKLNSDGTNTVKIAQHFYYIYDRTIYSQIGNSYIVDFEVESFCSIKTKSNTGEYYIYTCWYAIFVLIVWLVIFIVSIGFLIHFIKNKRKNLAVVEDNQDVIITKTNFT